MYKRTLKLAKAFEKLATDSNEAVRSAITGVLSNSFDSELLELWNNFLANNATDEEYNALLETGAEIHLPYVATFDGTSYKVFVKVEADVGGKLTTNDVKIAAMRGAVKFSAIATAKLKNSMSELATTKANKFVTEGVSSFKVSSFKVLDITPQK